MKLLWKNSSEYIKFPFPFEAITPEQYEIINGWSFFDNTTRKAIRTAGWAERNTSGVITAMYSGIISLGSIGALDYPYYFQTPTNNAVNFTFSGPVNEAVLVYSDPNGDGDPSDGFDYRDTFKIYVREMQKTFSAAQLSDIGVSHMTYIVYRFPLANDIDLKVTNDDTYIEAHPEIYNNINITFYEDTQTRSIGGVDYPFNIIINGAGYDYLTIYEKIQYLLRKNTNINSGTGSKNGKISNSLLKFIGSNMETSQGVYIDNFNANNTNQITFTDSNDVGRFFPFVAAGTIIFNNNLSNDGNAVYRMFFTGTPDGNYGTTDAIIVKDSSNNDISGIISGNSISFSFNYDSNNQGGRTPGTDAQVTVVGIGLKTGTYTTSTSTITRSVGQTIQLVAGLERNYVNT